MGIATFADEGTQDVFNGRNSKKARAACPAELLRVARRKLEQLNAVPILGDLRFPPGNRLEALSGDRKGQHSIRINDRYRVCFRWADAGIHEVEIVDYHKG